MLLLPVGVVRAIMSRAMAVGSPGPLTVQLTPTVGLAMTFQLTLTVGLAATRAWDVGADWRRAATCLAKAAVAMLGAKRTVGAT